MAYGFGNPSGRPSYLKEPVAPQAMPGYDPTAKAPYRAKPAAKGAAPNPYARGGYRGEVSAPGQFRTGDTTHVAYRPNASTAAGYVPPATVGAGANPYGTESGNTYLEDRYLNRMGGEDLAYNYAAKRGMEGLGNQYAAAGMANSGAARQGESDFLANLTAQSQGQLDSLAAGATGARQRKTESMFNTGLGLAGGQAGTMSPYALGSAGAMSAADQAYLYMMLNKAGVEGQARQGGLNALFNVAKLGAGRPGG